MRIRRIWRWRPRWLRRLELRIKTALANSSLERIAKNAHLRERVLREPWAREAIAMTLGTREAQIRHEVQVTEEAAYQDRVAREFATCRQPWHWEKHRWQQRPGGRFLFVVGCGHSGTTILHRLIGEHPEVHAVVKESNLFINFTDDQILTQLGEWEADARREEKRVVLEKTPFHLYYFNRINEFVPNCHFVSMLRDGRDVVASYMASGRSMEWGIDYWTHCMRYEDELHRTQVQHQQVRLEDLVAAPQQVLHNLLRALGLTSSPEIIDHMLRYHESPKPYYHSTIERPDNALEGENMAKHRTFQVNQPLFSSTSRWKKEIPQSQWPGLTESLQPWLKSHGYAEEMA